jgi:type III pantothenate kinase
MIIAADIGNTRIKLGLFEQEELSEVLVFAHDDIPTALENHPRFAEIRSRLQYLGLSSVGKDVMAQKLLGVFSWLSPAQVLEISTLMPMPIGNDYHSPATLGIDRICVAVAAHALEGKGPVLVVDAGTALKFDFVDAHGRYQGGGISPGIRMRFRALHEFTARLPLVEEGWDADLIGRDTVGSMRSGVVNGILAEIDGIIQQYRQAYGEELPVYLTGGDSGFLRNHLKNHNFADAFLLLRGIHLLIRYNVQVH